MRALYAAICIPFGAQAAIAQNNLPEAKKEKTIVFTAPDQNSARDSAANWVESKHGGIYLRKFTVVQEGGKFVATITYGMHHNFLARRSADFLRARLAGIL